MIRIEKIIPIQEGLPGALLDKYPELSSFEKTPSKFINELQVHQPMVGRFLDDNFERISTFEIFSPRGNRFFVGYNFGEYQIILNIFRHRESYTNIEPYIHFPDFFKSYYSVFNSFKIIRNGKLKILNEIFPLDIDLVRPPKDFLS